jgi:hypothetical protein
LTACPELCTLAGMHTTGYSLTEYARVVMIAVRKEGFRATSRRVGLSASSLCYWAKHPRNIPIDALTRLSMAYGHPRPIPAHTLTPATPQC